MRTNKEKRRYASSNSFLGFRSYFNKAFASSEFDEIFVIKGGPGCGKNSAMRKIASYALSEGAEVELIFCSSDIRSLDGVIINAGKKIGILDGTAPHERDAVIVGAIDSLWNFGDHLDKNRLKSKRDEILYLHNKKRDEYSKAYCELHFSYEYWINIKAEYLKSINSDKIEKALGTLDSLFSFNGIGVRERLLSSFSKDGYSTLLGPYTSKKQYYINGDKAQSSILCTLLSEKLLRKHSRFFSPLDPMLIEGMCDGEDNVLTIHSGDEPLFDSADFFSPSSESERLISDLTENMKAHVKSAKEHLERASEYHFLLEEIYSPAMDFSSADETVEKMMEKIKNIMPY